MNDTLNDCVDNSVCYNTDGSYTCECKVGYTGIGNISCESTYTTIDMTWQYNINLFHLCRLQCTCIHNPEFMAFHALN